MFDIRIVLVDKMTVLYKRLILYFFMLYFVAASEAVTIMTLSMFSTTSLEEVAQKSTGLKWLNLQVDKGGKIAKDLITRGEKHGYKAIVITVDQPNPGRRYVTLRKKPRIAGTLNMTYPNLDKDETMKAYDEKFQTMLKSFYNHSLTWDVIPWLRSITKLPIVIKGILTKEDAELAVQHGVDGIWVSNHGGRQLDTVPATVSSIV